MGNVDYIDENTILEKEKLIDERLRMPVNSGSLYFFGGNSTAGGGITGGEDKQGQEQGHKQGQEQGKGRKPKPALQELLAVDEKVAKLYVQALMGDSHAQFEIGWMYHLGEGVEKNDEKAALWYEVSAEQGYNPAENNLANMYCDGVMAAGMSAEAEKVIKRDHSRAFELWGRAFKHGNIEAIYNLGLAYEFGYGVSPNLKMALEFYEKALPYGFSGAERHDPQACVDRVRSKLGISSDKNDEKNGENRQGERSRQNVKNPDMGQNNEPTPSKIGAPDMGREM
jgi:hypothetical protein